MLYITPPSDARAVSALSATEIVIDPAQVLYWDEPEQAHIDHDNVPPCDIMASVSICMIKPAYVAAWFPRSMYALKPEMLHVFWYIDVLLCVICNCTQQERLKLLVPAVKIINKRQVGECAAVAAQKVVNTGNSETTNELAVLLFYDIHIDIDETLNLLQCLHDICGCRALKE